MGDRGHYTSPVHKPWGTTDLAQLGDLGVEVGEGGFQHLTMAGILRCFQLLQQTPTGQSQPLGLPLACKLGRAQQGLGFVGRNGCLGLLLFDRLALPSARHTMIIGSSRRRRPRGYRI